MATRMLFREEGHETLLVRWQLPEAKPKGRASMYPGKDTITERIVKAGSLGVGNSMDTLWGE